MSNSLVEFCASTSALEPSVASQKFQNISCLLVNESDLIFFISYIPQFQKTVRKAAWKSCQKKIKENGNETHLIEEAFKDQKTEHLKKDFAYFISSFSDPKCLLGPETFLWLLSQTSAALESFSDIQDLATLTKILNSIIKVLSAEQLSSISSVIPFLSSLLARCTWYAVIIRPGGPNYSRIFCGHNSARPHDLSWPNYDHIISSFIIRVAEL